MQMTCGHSRMMKSMLCSMTTKLPPWLWFSVIRSSRSWSTSPGLTPAQGSSSRTRRGEGMNAIAMSMSFCCPYESRPAGRCATCVRRNSSIIASACAPSPASGLPKRRPGIEPRNSCAAAIRLSRTESCVNTCSVWNVRPTPRRASSSGDIPVMSSPQNSTAPDDGLIWPRMLLKSVVLPEPFGPMTPTISPGPTENETPSTARIAP